eukprot:m.120789 g.120789  ORF g.120789 m.120789 type:complete len:756 (+) comp16183_c2_seq1:69-2336(+)
MSKSFKVGKCPNDKIALTNRLAVKDESLHNRHAFITCSKGKFAYTLIADSSMAPDEVGFNAVHRKYMELALKQDISVQVISPSEMIGQLVVELDFMKKMPAAASMTFDSNIMLEQFITFFNNSIFEIGEPLVFMHTPASGADVQFQATVKGMTKLDLATMKMAAPSSSFRMGILTQQTMVVFEVSPNSSLVLTGSAKGKSASRSVFNPDWDFTKMGIGGLDDQFQTMFRRAFASRVLPLDVIKRMGMKHVRGILLYGPPGTGKTLMARQIGKMLQGREPKVVNGPEVLNKFVGESEANIRRLFEDAEKEQKERGDNSGLHIIIFDEIDSICKSRGSVSNGTGVHDSLVNQLLSKIDGVDSLNNVLLIGMTNRIDLLDEALLRPGRLELKIQIGLPNEEGRLQIFRIHTKHLQENGMLDAKVDLHELARRTKNFSGAEIEGLVRCANSYATNRCVNSKTMAADEEKLRTLRVTMEDFELAMTEILPAFGVSSEEINRCTTGGIVPWGRPVDEFLRNGHLLLELMRNSDRTNLVSVLVEGPVQSGKTALAAHLAMLSEFPLVKMISPENMVGYSETAKLNAMHKIFEDAYRSQRSVVIVDDVERLMEYSPLGERFSNFLLQALMVLIKKPPKNETSKLLVLCTTSNRRLMDRLGFTELFSKVMSVPNMTEAAQVMHVLGDLNKMSTDDNVFNDAELGEIAGGLVQAPFQQGLSIGVKKVYLFAEMAKQSRVDRAKEFLALMYDAATESSLFGGMSLQ